MSLAWVLTSGCLLTPAKPVGESSNSSAWLPRSPQPVSGEPLCPFLLHTPFSQPKVHSGGKTRLRLTEVCGSSWERTEPRGLMSPNRVWMFSAGSRVAAMRFPHPLLCVSPPSPTCMAQLGEAHVLRLPGNGRLQLGRVESLLGPSFYPWVAGHPHGPQLAFLVPSASRKH